MNTATLPLLTGSEPLFSDHWHRVAALRPRLRPQVSCQFQAQRGEAFFLLRDTGSDASVRLNREAYEFVGRCDGHASVQQIWDALATARPGEDGISQPEVVTLLVGLHQRGLVQFDVTPDVEAMFLLSDQRRRRRRNQAVNPLAFRLPMGDPSRLVAVLERRLRPLLNGWGAAVWLALVLLGAMVAAMEAGALAQHTRASTTTPGFALLLWLVFPVIKALHEAAHAVCMAHWGVPVRQAGISLLMLNPVPYVDASAADGLRNRYRRALVSAAGIATELALAATAVLVWALVQPGWTRDLALAVALTGGLSSLLVNGNPLLRFDGYFVMCDLLDLRNLAPRSARWWVQRVGHRITGLTPRLPLTPLPREVPWLWLYAPLSLAWRIALSVLVVMWVGSLAAWLGTVLAVALLYVNLLKPAHATWHTWQEEWRHVGTERDWPLLRLATEGLGLLALFTLVPLPAATVAQGVVWLPDQARLRAGTDGFVQTLLARDGELVVAGQLIARLENTTLPARLASAQSDVAELDVRLFRAQDRAPHEAPALREQLAVAHAELARLDEQWQQREVRAQTSGRLVLPMGPTLLGRYVSRGDALGHVLGDGPLTVRVAVPQQEAERVAHTTGVAVRLSHSPGQAFSSHVVQQVPGTQRQLPSAALGALGGGPLAVDPGDETGLRTQAPVVVLDVALDTPATSHPAYASHGAPPHFGARAQVRFAQQPSPLVQQMLRGLRQLALGHFQPSQ